jgi:hypothetical protein
MSDAWKGQEPYQTGSLSRHGMLLLVHEAWQGNQQDIFSSKRTMCLRIDGVPGLC